MGTLPGWRVGPGPDLWGRSQMASAGKVGGPKSIKPFCRFRPFIGGSRSKCKIEMDTVTEAELVSAGRLKKTTFVYILKNIDFHSSIRFLQGESKKRKSKQLSSGLPAGQLPSKIIKIPAGSPSKPDIAEPELPMLFK